MRSNSNLAMMIPDDAADRIQAKAGSLANSLGSEKLRTYTCPMAGRTLKELYLICEAVGALRGCCPIAPLAVHSQNA